MHSHYDFNFVLEQDLRIITKLIKKSIKKRDKDKIWQMWVSQLPHMTQDSFISFEEYYDRFKEQEVEISNTATEDIYKMAESIIQADKGSE